MFVCVYMCVSVCVRVRVCVCVRVKNYENNAVML